MRKMAWFCIGLLMAVFLTSCAMYEDFVVQIDPPKGHPPFEVQVTATKYDDGVYVFEAGGQVIETEENKAVFTVDDWPWSVKVEWTDGGVVKSVTERVGLENQIPIAYDLYTVPDQYLFGQKVLIDLRYLEHGCNNGEPLLYTGIKDPDGDELMYRVEVEDVATGKYESVYTPDRKLLTDWTYSPKLYWFVGWHGTDPPIPFSPRCQLDPWEEPDPAGDTVKKIHVYVKEWGQARHWVYEVSG